MGYLLIGKDTFPVLLLIIFFCSAVDAQDESRLLFPGLLGYTGGSENDAILLAPAASGQVYSGPLKPGSGRLAAHIDESFNLRLGTLSVSDDNYEGGAFIGLSLEKNVHEYISLRGSLDYGEITHDRGAYSYSTARDESLTSFKISLLAHPDQSEGSEYFNPYLGLGAELDYFDSETAFGVHILAGVEYVFDSISIGIEASYSSVGDTGTEREYMPELGRYSTVDRNPSNFAILLNVGFRF